MEVLSFLLLDAAAIILLLTNVCFSIQQQALPSSAGRASLAQHCFLTNGITSRCTTQTASKVCGLTS